MPFAQIGDLRFYYERTGKGLPLLFISGTGGDLRTLPKQVSEPLAHHFDLLTYDQRGLGQSSKPDVAFTMADYADDAARLMDYIGWKRARVIGVSFGGMVAQEFALRHPRMVERLVLACTSPGGAGGSSFAIHQIEHMSKEQRARYMVPIVDLRHDEEWQKQNPLVYEDFVKMASYDPYADEPGHSTGYHRQLEARAKFDAYNRLHEINCPVLIAAGRFDGIASPKSQRKMAERIRGSSLEFFDGGHWFLLQDPTAFPTILDFLKR